MRRPSPALVIACLALLVAFTGTSYATVLNVPKNSVGAPELKRNAVKAAKIAPNAVRTGHVLDGSLLTADFKAGQIPQGPKGDKGDKGDAGSTGPPGISGYEIVTMPVTATTTSHSASVSCPGAKRVLGGGVAASSWSLGNGPYVITSRPNAAGTGWDARMAFHNFPGGTTTLTAYAVCASVS
jgi:hypothetical protein